VSNLAFLVDTNVVIALLKDEQTSVDLLDGVGSNSANTTVSVITRIELLSFPNLEGSEETRILAFLADCTVPLISDDVEAASISFRRSTRAKLPDAIIAATAHVHGLCLLTFDEKLARLALTP